MASQANRALSRRKFLSTGTVLGSSLALTAGAIGQEPTDKLNKDLSYRISKRDSITGDATGNQQHHPLDPALKLAYNSLHHIRASIRDYTAVVVKREQINGSVSEYEYLGVKIRNRQVENGKIKVPFSVYLTFLAPASMKGREVIYVEGQNAGKLVAHEGGMKGRFLPTVSLDPNGMMAMRNQRYPITDMGVENLVVKLIEKGERDRSSGPCKVEFQKGAKVDKRECTVVTVKHDVKKPCYDFCEAQIFIDNEYNVPVRYCAYEWPRSAGGEKRLLEEYTYLQLKTNVGLTDMDFNPENPKYRF